MKKILYYIAFPFVFIWVAFVCAIFYTGTGLVRFGNWMSGHRLDDSIGSVYIDE